MNLYNQQRCSRLLLTLMLLHSSVFFPLLCQKLAGNIVSEVVQCHTRSKVKVCDVTGELGHTCANQTESLVLRFTADTAASWSADASVAGLKACDSVRRVKITGWSDPRLHSGHVAQLPGVQFLAIVDGGLTFVGANVGSERLQKLSLTGNAISELDPSALTRCDRLSSLDLSKNLLARLPDGLLTGCRSLRVLRLNGNRLTELRPEFLRGAVGLQELHAQRNRFRVLHNLEGAFGASRSLQLVDLRDNQFFAYRPGPAGFCGPANVTVMMHHSGCPPSTAEATRICTQSDKSLSSSNECLGTSAHLTVTFTSCPVAILPLRKHCQTAKAATKTTKTALTRTREAACPTIVASLATSKPDDDVHTLMLQSLGLRADGLWLLYALAGTVVFCILLLIVSLAVCYRLKLRIARLQARSEAPMIPPYNGELPLCNYHPLYSQSFLYSGAAKSVHGCGSSIRSGRLTSSGKELSRSTCSRSRSLLDGASQSGVEKQHLSVPNPNNFPRQRLQLPHEAPSEAERDEATQGLITTQLLINSPTDSGLDELEVASIHAE